MIHVTPIRRPVGGLRKPSIPVKIKIPPKPTCSPPRLIVNEELQAKLCMLDDESLHQQDAVKEEILAALKSGTITAKGCLQLFLNTAWEDRNRKPLIAKLFHKITQETDADIASLIEMQCDNLLNILTLLGKPDISDLSMVTLLANLHQIEDLPDEHRNGVEMYLMDIAKAFWPYFLPDKHKNIWNDDICDAICDVLHTVGETLDCKCPVNMERTFNNITIMLFSSSLISSYTLLRFLELKEFRAAKWSLTSSAKSYYKSAYLKHPRTSSSSSPASDSPTSQSNSDDDDDVFTSPTETKASIKADLNNETACRKEVKTDIIHDSNNESTCREEVKTDIIHDSNNETACREEVKTDIIHDSNNETACREEVKADIIHDSNNETACREEVKTDIHDSNYKVTVRRNTVENGVHNTVVVHVKELQCKQEDRDRESIKRPFDSHDCNNSVYKDNQISNTVKSSCRDNEHCSAQSVVNSGGFGSPSGSPTNPDKGLPELPKVQSTSSPSLSTNPTSMADNERNHPVNLGGFPGSTTSNPGYPDTNRSPSSGGFGLPGQHRPRGFSVPGNTNTPHGGFPNQRTHHTFQRTQSENDSTRMSDSLLQGQLNNGGTFPRFQRSSSYERYHSTSMLEFPVQDINVEESNHSSRLYLLSFATQASALERPTDLTLTPELEAEKSWLKDVILPKAVTVLDRFG